MIALIMFLFLGGAQNKPKAVSATGVGKIGISRPYEFCTNDNAFTCTDGMCTVRQECANVMGSLDPQVQYNMSGRNNYAAGYEYPFRIDAEGHLYYETTLATGIVADDGSQMVKLSDAEYSHLQELRKAVADEEKRLAAKYGAELENPKPCPPYCVTTGTSYIWHPDHYEYHGQFLLIERVK